MSNQARPSLTLCKTIYTMDQLDLPDAPQIAMAGRSNVGKSSLINCLAGRKDLAKTSSTPGKTRSLNFYCAEPGGFYLVDLPGYGFAQTSKNERAKWARLIEAYIRDNPRLKAVCILIDCRLSPQRLDLDLVAFVQLSNIALIPVLTKADKCKLRERSARQRDWAPFLGDARTLLFSSKTGQGRDELWSVFQEIAGGDEEASV